MSNDTISPDPDPIRHSEPSPGGELPTPTPPDAAPEDPTPPDAPVGDAAGLPDGTLPEADGGVIETEESLDGTDTVAANDLLDGGEVDRGN